MKRKILFKNSQGVSLVELLVALGISAGAISLLAYLSMIGSLSRGGIEKKTESFQMGSSLISKLYNSTFNDIELICQSKGALERTAADPCVAQGQIKILDPKGNHPLGRFFDSTIRVTSMQNSSKTDSAVISCVHINNCRYLIDGSLIEVQLIYHWHEPLLAQAQSRRISFRRGLR